NLLSRYPVTRNPPIEAGKRNKKSTNSPFPDAHAISVVISPKGLHAPPAFAATTMFIAPGTKNEALLLSIVIRTVDNIRAVVKLSATGDIKNANNPVAQNSFL